MPVDTHILAPAAFLALWTLIVLIWMAATRFPAMKKVGLQLDKAPPGGRGQDLEPVLPPSINWISHNHTHLHEQPTLFYAVVVILALCGQGYGLNLWLAWAYACLRIVHSLWQIFVNRIPVRFMLFLCSTLCLFGLTIHAVIATVRF